MWQGTGSTTKWNLSCYSPRVRAVFVWFSLICSGGGARQRQQWHLIPLPTRAGRRWQMVWQGPRPGFVAETERFVALSTIFLLACFCALLPTFRFSVFFSFLFFPCIPVCLSSCPFVCAAAICCSPHVSTYFIVRVLSACVICTLPHLGIILFFYSFSIFFVALISRVAFFCCALVPGTLALDWPALII